MNPGGSRFSIWLVVVCIQVLMVLPAAAEFGTGTASYLGEKTYHHPALQISNQYVPASSATVKIGNNDLRAALSELDVTPDNALLDPRTGRWGTIIFAKPLLPGTGKGNTLQWNRLGLDSPAGIAGYQETAWLRFAEFLGDHTATLGINIDELLDSGKVTVHDEGRLIQIYAGRTIEGIGVRDSYITAVINNGNLVLFGARNWAGRRAAPAPTVSANDAGGAVQQHLGASYAATRWKKPHLVYVPLAIGNDPRFVTPGEGLELKLAWVLRADVPGDLGFFEALVDAHDGTLLSFEDTRSYAETRQVVGGVYPVSNDGVGIDGSEQAGFPMPFADLTVGEDKYFTDSGGNLPLCVDGEISTNLDGRYVRIVDTCGDINESTTGAVLDLGVHEGSDCTVPAGHSAGDTHASRTTFFELNRSMAQGRGQLPTNDWLQEQVTANVNISETCNARWDGTEMFFYVSGGGCANTGEIATVVAHEFGHGLDDNGAIPSLSNPKEGIANIYASLRQNTSCIGRGFRPSNCGGFGDPCTACDGVTDIDWEKRSSGQPHDIEWIDANCGNSFPPAPCGGIDHCESAVYAEAVWDLWNRDLLAPTFNMSLDTARELTTLLTYQGAGFVGSWYQCSGGSGTGDGCNADGGYFNYLAADDDDGDLSNGTPHMTAIFAAFNRHGIACVAPPVQDSGCATTPTTSPQVSALAIDRGVRLSWDSVDSASEYRVYRTDGVHNCAFGKELVVTTGALTFFDDGLANGRQYSYIVIPASGDSCLGPASTCTTTSPVASARVLADVSSGSLVFQSGDADEFIDNCETVRVNFSVDNTGIAAATNLVITDIQSSNEAVNNTIKFSPLIASSLAACDSAQSSLSFTASTLSFGVPISFNISVTADEMGGVSRGASLQFDETESDSLALSSKTFNFESDLDGWNVLQPVFNRTPGGADGTAFALSSSGTLGNACDRIRSPHLLLEPTSTVSLWTKYDIEGFSGGSWYDRASLGIFDESGVRSLIEPDGGRPYNATQDSNNDFPRCNAEDTGWAGSEPTWATSSFSATAINAAALSEQPVHLDMIYATDSTSSSSGFSFDEVTVTDVTVRVVDAQADLCELVFGDGFEISINGQ